MSGADCLAVAMGLVPALGRVGDQQSPFLIVPT